MIGKENRYEDTTTFLIYPSMTQTMALMREHGYHLQSVQESDEIKSITIRYSGTLNDWKRMLGMEISDYQNEIELNMNEDSVAWEYYEEKGYLVVEEGYQEIAIEITDPTEIKEIQKALIHQNYASEFGPFPLRFRYLNAEVYFEVDTEEATDGLVGWTEAFRFKEDEVPQFVIDRILEELEAGIGTIAY